MRRGMVSRALLAVGVLGLLTTAPAAAAGTGWSTPTLLGSSSNLSAPALGVDGDGRTIVAWSQGRQSGGGRDPDAERVDAE